MSITKKTWQVAEFLKKDRRGKAILRNMENFVESDVRRRQGKALDKQGIKILSRGKFCIKNCKNTVSYQMECRCNFLPER